MATATLQNLGLPAEQYAFVDTLVAAITGYTLAELPAEELHLPRYCLDFYDLYIEDYFSRHFLVRDVMQLKAYRNQLKENGEVDSAFRTKYRIAHTEFINLLRAGV